MAYKYRKNASGIVRAFIVDASGNISPDPGFNIEATADEFAAAQRSMPPPPSQSDMSRVGAQGDQTVRQGINLVALGTRVISATADAAKGAMDAMQMGLDAIDKSGMMEPMKAMQDIFGMSRTAFAQMKDESNEFVDNELQNFLAVDKALINRTGPMAEFFSHKDGKKAYESLIIEMNNMNAMALKSFDGQERQRAMLYQKNLKLSTEQVTKLVQRSYAETGEASDSMLERIAANSFALSKKIGVGQKDLANEMTEILTDTKTFTNMSEDSAARMAATYKQLGVDLNVVKGLINNFRSFDNAAQKIGDLSMAFGIQLDAMEMMALANEDEEEFLMRMREQMIDQGVDVENMSKSRLRMLGDQMGGMDPEQLKTFFRTGELAVDQASQQQAIQDAQTKSTAETVEQVQQMHRSLRLSNKQILALGQAKGMIELRQNMAKIAISGDRFNLSLQRTIPASVDASKAVGMILKATEGQMNRMTALLRKARSPGARQEFFKGMMGFSTQDFMAGFATQTTEGAGEAGDAAGRAFKTSVDYYTQESSLPRAWRGLESGLKWIAANAGDPSDLTLGGPLSRAGTAVGAAFTSAMSAEIEASMVGLSQKITDGITAAGPLNVSVNASVDTQGTTSQGVTSVTKLDAAGLAAELSSLGLKDAAAALSALPGDIKSKLETLTIENQSASQLEAAAVNAQTLSIENSPAFTALTTTLATLTTEQKTALEKIATALATDREISIDLLMNDKIFAKAMKAYTFTDGRTFKIHHPE